MPKDIGTPGNTLQSQADFDRILHRLGVAVRRIDYWCENTVTDWGRVTSIRLKAPEQPGGEWLAVIRVSTENGGVVGFHSAEDVTALISGLSGRLSNGNVKWKEDEYA